jgi:hypothetical protein
MATLPTNGNAFPGPTNGLFNTPFLNNGHVKLVMVHKGKLTRKFRRRKREIILG